MKGIVFTSFLDFVENQFGVGFLDQMLDHVATKSQGVYTSVGTYDHEELIAYIVHINHIKAIDVPVLVEKFGYDLFDRLGKAYPDLITQYNSSLECIEHIDQTIHRNVRKLYPKAELPNMHATFNSTGDELTLTYDSKRPFMHLAQGLIRGCIDHYGDDVEVMMNDRSSGQSNQATFVLKLSQ